MNKKFTFFAVLLVATLMFFNSESIAQGAKRYVLFEHFTNTGCGPCARQNPIFRKFYEKNTDKAHHLAFHTSWPSSNDPMYKYNIEENKLLTSYYGVTGVPDMYANGKGISSPVNADESILATAGTSPIKIIVKQETGDDSIYAKVTIKSIENVPAGNYIMRVAIVEKLFKFSGAPNGETEFPNVFRRFLTRNTPFTAASKGDKVVFEYKFLIDKNKWDPTQIYVLAYIVNTDNKNVLNSGSSLDFPIDVAIEENIKGNNDVMEFNFNIDNFTGENQSYTVLINGEYPNGWKYSIGYEGSEYQKLDTVFAPGRTPIKVTVNTNGIGGIGHFNFEISSDNNDKPLRSPFVVLNNVESLILTNKVPSGDDVDIVKPYTRGLEKSESKNFGYLGYKYFSLAFEDSLLNNMKNIFLSVGWFFPALNDKLTIQLEKFLDRGGNLMMSGQDIGWDILSGDNNSNGTALQKSFMSKYIRAKFLDDGSKESTEFKIVKQDPVFGKVSGSSINRIYGSQYLYPDQIEPKDNDGHVFMKYTNNNKPGGYWLQKDKYKVIYMGIGPEQITYKSTSDNLIKTAKDWFDGKISSIEFEELMRNLFLGNSNPNPADQFAKIHVNIKNGKDMKFSVYNIFGQKIFSQTLTTGQSEVKLNTAGFENGIYFYSISNGKSKITKKLVVQH